MKDNGSLLRSRLGSYMRELQPTLYIGRVIRPKFGHAERGTEYFITDIWSGFKLMIFPAPLGCGNALMTGPVTNNSLNKPMYLHVGIEAHEVQTLLRVAWMYVRRRQVDDI